MLRRAVALIPIIWLNDDGAATKGKLQGADWHLLNGLARSETTVSETAILQIPRKFLRNCHFCICCLPRFEQRIDSSDAEDKLQCPA